MDEYKRGRLEKAAQRKRFAYELVRLMPGWAVDPCPANADNDVFAFHLQGDGHARLYVNFDDYRRRIDIGAAWIGWGEDKTKLREHRRYDAKAHSITVAQDRPIKAIAAEIHRRLLPAYLAELTEVVARKAASDTNDDAVRASARMLAATLAGNESIDGRGFGYGKYGGPIRVEGKASGGIEGINVTMTIECTEAIARKILETIANLRRTR